jgi:hypothetical protein
MSRFLLAFCLTLPLAAVSAAAHDHDNGRHHNHGHDHAHDHGHTPLGPHAHGAAHLAMALDGEALVIEFESALYNIVGFERAPRNEAERQALADALDTLRDGAGLFAFSGGDCTAGEAELTELGHSDVFVRYHFTCTGPGQLGAVTLNLFDRFAALEKIEAAFIGDRQRAATLTPRGNRFDLR